MKSTAYKLAFAAALISAFLVVVRAQPSTRLDVLTLDRAADVLLQRNLTLEAARLEISAAERSKVLARLRPRATVTITADNLKLAGETPFSRLYETGVVFNQPIELGGRREARAAAAATRITVAEARLAAVLRSRLFEMKRIFYEALLAQERLKNDEEAAKNFDELIRFSEVRLQEGDISPGELTRIKLERIKYSSAVANARLAVRQSKIRLLEVIGETDFGQIDTIDLRESLDFTEIDLNLATLKATALERRPEIELSKAEIGRAEALIRLERSRAKGELVPYTGYRRVGVDNAVVAGITVPLPTGDRNQAAIAEAEVDQKLAENSLAQTRNRTAAEVEVAFITFETAREQVRAYRVGVLQQADESVNVSLLSYREGVAELISLLDAQRTRLEIRNSYFQALLAYHVSVFNLELITGTDLRK